MGLAKTVRVSMVPRMDVFQGGDRSYKRITMHITVHIWDTALLCFALYIVACVSRVSGFTYGVCELHDPEQCGGRTKFFCYKRSLEHVPPKFPHNVTDIDISHNKIKGIKSEDFQNLTHLETLNISYNSISYVEKGAFRDLISLTELGLSSNRLSIITKEFFQGLTNLKVLLLDKNNISTTENSSFSVFHHLECVKLSENKLTDMKLMQPIFRIQTLNEIHIASNNISNFQSINVSNSSLRLQILNLAHNPLNIFRISEDIFPYLQAINLSYCFSNRNSEWEVLNTSFFRNVKRLEMAGVNVSLERFKVILQTFNNSLVALTLSAVPLAKSLISYTCHIPTLTTLTLRNNNISSLKGTGLERCCQIRTLDLGHNRLADLENVLASLTNLTFLQLGYNKFSYIPSMIQNLSMLENLDLVFNQIEKLGCSTFKNLNNLKTLRLYRNRIKVVKDCVFQDLINLKKLYLGSNYISFLDRAFQNGPAKLEYLKLSSNSLASLKTNDFRGLKSLRTLILYDNKINSIDDGTFDKLISLKVLNLHFNKITDESLRPTVFSELSNLLELTLQNNHILKAEYFQTPPFYNLTSLKVLSVLSQRHHNNQSFLPYNFLQNLRHLHTFWAQNAGLKYLHDDVFKDNTQLAELALSGNDLTTLSLNVFLPLRKLYKLHLKETRLKTLDFLVQANLQDLYYLQISNNQISSINETIIMSLPGLRLLDMQGNTFTCDCSNAQFIKWLEKSNFTQVLAANTYECNSPPNFKETQLLNLDVSSCSENNELYYYISSTCLVLLTLIISLTYNFLHWQIVYGYYLFLAFLYDNKKKGSHKPLGFQYDAFVSYNKHDELWVTSELLPKLEGEQGWRLCLHHRDFQPGKPIVDNIVDGIYSSRKTICILSQHYLESEWCSREVQVASFRLFDEKKDVLILLFLEDIPVYRLSPYYRMRGLVKKRTYLSWPKAGQDTRVFWEKLRVALGARRGSEEENSLSDVQNVL
ncbi:toll-like receptor 13 isoform X1 [Alosa alosa]|uniref:toll-like receptor 13 isoform X1 n=1 Tax=Alosa alosa TaxID=278164 RepID=UPI0020153831|nr:toll-like receptor 13 isoform X1 [Alosa alosa]